MSDGNTSPTPGEKKRDEPEQAQDRMPPPYEGVISQVANRIKSEPFLFVIAIVALLIGLVLQATGLASPDLRFLVIVIASIAFAAILGYYVLESRKLHFKGQKHPLKESGESTDAKAAAPGQRITGHVKAKEISGQAQLRGVRAGKEAIQYTGDIRGDVDVASAKGGSAFGVEIGGEDSGKRRKKDKS